MMQTLPFIEGFFLFTLDIQGWFSPDHDPAWNVDVVFNVCHNLHLKGLLDRRVNPIYEGESLHQNYRKMDLFQYRKPLPNQQQPEGVVWLYVDENGNLTHEK